MAKKRVFKRVLKPNELNMQCDRCHSDQNEVLILRKHKFTKKGRFMKDYHRVCFRCARQLTNNGDYDLGEYWRGVFWYHEVRIK